jgi:Flp pilus assembly secretin CpaC
MLPMKSIWLLSAAIFASGPANAQQSSQIIEIKPSFSVAYRFDRVIKTVAIGNSEIIDAVAQNDRAILISARRAGETNVIGIDLSGVIFSMLLLSLGEAKPVAFKFIADEASMSIGCTDVAKQVASVWKTLLSE